MRTALISPCLSHYSVAEKQRWVTALGGSLATTAGVESLASFPFFFFFLAFSLLSRFGHGNSPDQLEPCPCFSLSLSVAFYLVLSLSLSCIPTLANFFLAISDCLLATLARSSFVVLVVVMAEKSPVAFPPSFSASLSLLLLALCLCVYHHCFFSHLSLSLPQVKEKKRAKEEEERRIREEQEKRRREEEEKARRIADERTRREQVCAAVSVARTRQTDEALFVLMTSFF